MPTNSEPIADTVSPIGSPTCGATVPIRFIDALRDHLLTGDALGDHLMRPHVPVRTPTARDPFRRIYAFLQGVEGEMVAMQKDGINADIASFLAHHPQTETTIAILANQDCTVWAIQRELRALLAFLDAVAATA